jgi:hypothetical protein
MRKNWITLSVLVAFGCSDASLKTFNAEPTATITSHADGEELLEEASTTLQGKVADSDHDEVDLVTTWRVNGEAICEDVAPEEDGTTRCSTTLSTGAVTVALEVSDPGRATGSDSVSFTVTPNAPPDVSLTDPFEGERYQAGEAIEFKGRVTDEEDAFDVLTLSIESDIQGTLDLNTTLNSEGRFSDFGYLDAGTHIITVTATDSGGKTGRDQEEVEVQPANSAPTIASVEITPDPATATDVLSCIISDFADADGDADNSTYEWTVNGTVAGTNETLSDAFVAGDEVVCTVTPSDGEDEGEPVSDSIIISNTAPEMLDVIIEPGEEITTSTTLSCEATWADVDGETLEPTYQWTRGDGTDFGTDNVLVLEPLFATPGDVYTCTATVTDGAGASDSGSDSATVGNTAPEVIEVVIAPDTSVSATMTLTCTATAEDADGEVPTLTYEWDIEGFDMGDGDTLDLTTTGAVSGETVTCTATATDAIGDTDTGTDSVLIENTAPEIDSVTLSPDPVYTNDTITATATASDAEDDDVTVTYDWYVNDGLVATGTGDTLSGVTTFDKHDEVYVVATPSDGTDDGEALTSDTLTASNTPPTAPEVSIVETLTEVCGEVRVLFLDGVDDAVQLDGGDSSGGDPSSMDFTKTDDFTLEIWFKLGTVDARDVLFQRGDISGARISLHIEDGAFVGEVYSSGAVGTTVTSLPGVVIPGEWYHVGLSRDVGSQLKLYINGVEVDSAADAAEDLSWGELRRFALGRQQSGDYYANVYLSEARVWSTARSAEQIDAHWRAILSGTEPDLAGYWSFTETSGTLAPDLTGNGADGTLFGGATWTAVEDLCRTETEAIVCEITSPSTDADGDPITYDFAWDVDGESYTDTDTDTHDGDTVPGDALASDETWTCTVTPNDGEEDGEPGSDSWATDAAPGCGSLHFDGSDRVDVSSIPDIEDKVTFEMWFKPEVVDGVPAWIDDWYVELCPGGSAGIIVEEFIDASCTDTWSVDTWHHLVGAWDFGTGTKSVWINGTPVGTHPASGTPPDLDALIFGDSSSGTDGYVGLIGGIHLWNRILTDGEVSAHYLEAPGISSPGLVAAWTFHEGSGSTLTDVTGNGFDGVISGATWSEECPDIYGDCWTATHGDSTYAFCPDRLGREAAEAQCDSFGMDLVKITTADENDFVFTEAVDVGGWAHPGPWIGLQDKDLDGTFAWNDGESLDYTEWCGSHPIDPGGRAYVHMELTIDDSPCWAANGSWSSAELEYVCESVEPCTDGTEGSLSFEFTDDIQVFSVPDCVTEITVEAYGAQGGWGWNTDISDSLGQPGLGGYARAAVPVSPGEVLQVTVGGAGEYATSTDFGLGGFNGGGDGAPSPFAYFGGGGGGATDIRRGTALEDRLVVAGGGGGGSGWCTAGTGKGGHGGGVFGDDGLMCTGYLVGTGGGPMAGGDLGGVLGIGGSAEILAGAGGGGGYYGGGASNGSGAGGGSGLTSSPGSSDELMENGVNPEEGTMVISW